jgi:hypothetical protein
MARLLADENFPLPAVEELRRLGHDVLTLREAGKSGLALPDGAILQLARDEGRALLTLNRWHFVRLHDANPDHAGIVACTFDVDFAGQAARIHAALAGRAELAGVLVRVNRPGR